MFYDRQLNPSIHKKTRALKVPIYLHFSFRLVNHSWYKKLLTTLVQTKFCSCYRCVLRSGIEITLIQIEVQLSTWYFNFGCWTEKPSRRRRLYIIFRPFRDDERQFQKPSPLCVISVHHSENNTSQSSNTLVHSNARTRGGQLPRRNI